MFDAYSQSLIDSLPDLPDLDRDACRRALSAAYFYVVSARIGMRPLKGVDSNRARTRLLLRRMVDALESVAVFDQLSGVNRNQIQRSAAAFVAAEALAL